MGSFWLTLADNIVAILIVLPLLGAGLALALARYGADVVRDTVRTNVLLMLVLMGVMVAHFDPQAESSDHPKASWPDNRQLVQMRTDLRWLAEWKGVVQPSTAQERTDTAMVPRTVGPDVRFSVGVDGISFCMVVLTVLLTSGVVLADSAEPRQRPALYYAVLLLVEAGMIGTFAALDVVLFCVFLELTLLALVVLAGIWGGYGRRGAVRGLALYSLTSSGLIVFGLIALALACSWMQPNVAGSHESFSLSIPDLTRLVQDVLEHDSDGELWNRISPWIFVALLLGFALQVPIVPFHKWYVEANVEAPTAASVLLSGVRLGVGCYGVVRFLIPLFPEACQHTVSFVGAIAIVGAVYSALLALSETNPKRLVSYVCVSHGNLCLLGLFSLNTAGVTGGLLQLFAHGLSVGLLFLMLPLLGNLHGSASLRPHAQVVPHRLLLRALVVVVVFALMGVPGLSGFVPGLLVLLGVFTIDAYCSDWGVTFAIWSLFVRLLLAWALLRFLQRIAAGQEHNRPTTDAVPQRPTHLPATARTLVVLLALSALVPGMGVYPQFLLDRVEPSVASALRSYRGAGQSNRSGRLVPQLPTTEPVLERPDPGTGNVSREDARRESKGGQVAHGTQRQRNGPFQRAVR